MVANLEVVDGLAQFVFNAEHGDPWHLGMLESHAVRLDNPQSWGEFVNAIRENRPAVLSNHSLQPMEVNLGDVVLPVPDHFAVVREHDSRIIPGVVGSRFHLGQPIDALDALRTLTADVGGEPSTAGLLGAGSRFFACAKVKEFSLDLGGGDSVERYVMVAFGFDGSLSRNYLLSSIRPVCSNTVSAAFAQRNNENSRKVRNTSFTFDSRNEEALADMSDIIRSFVGENERIVRMVETRSREEDIANIAKAVFGESKQASRIADEIENISLTAPGQECDTAQGNLWGVHNAFSYYIDHASRVTGTRKGYGDSLEVESGAAAADKLLSHRLWGKGADHRSKVNVAIDALLDDRKPIVAQVSL